MADKDGKVTLGVGTFPAGAKVGLHHRVGDFPSEGNVGFPVKTATVEKDGTVEFGGLEPGAVYYAASPDPFRAVAVTAKAPAAAPQRTPGRPSEQVRSELAHQAQAHADFAAPPVTGMRSTATAKPRKSQAQTEGRPSMATPSASPEANRQTAESAQRTEKALAKQNPAELDSVDEGAWAIAVNQEGGDLPPAQPAAAGSPAHGLSVDRVRDVVIKGNTVTQKRGKKK